MIRRTWFAPALCSLSLILLTAILYRTGLAKTGLSFWDSFPLMRLSAATTAGAALGLGGFCYQTSLRNPLAGPGILGVTHFSQLAVIILISYFPGALISPFLGAFLAGALALVLVFSIAGGLKAPPTSVALAGVITSLCAAAFINVIVVLRGDSLTGLMFWASGTPEQLDWNNLVLVGPLILALLFLLLSHARSLELSTLDDEVICALGHKPNLLRLSLLGIGTLFVAGGVVLTGPVSFLGLIAPNLVRLMVLANTRQRMLAVSLLGALLLLFADLLATSLEGHGLRTVAGTIIALLGAPLFLILLHQEQRRDSLKAHQPRKLLFSSSFTRSLFVSLLILLIVALVLLSVLIGEVNLKLSEIIAIITRQADASSLIQLALEIRVSRATAALAGGALLACSGFCLQTVTRNPIAGPEVLGLTSGTALGAVLSNLWIGSFFLATLSGGLLGGMLLLLLVFLICHKEGSTRRLILAGIIIGGACTAATSIVLLSADLRLVQIVTWLSGTIYQVTPATAFQLALITVIMLLGLSCASRILSLVALDQDLQQTLGFHPQRLRFSLLVCACLMVAFVVSTLGAISFVGLVPPALARRMGFKNPRNALLMAAALGAILLLSADLIGRYVAAPTQIPAGTVAAIIGAPIFLLLLLHR